MRYRGSCYLCDSGKCGAMIEKTRAIVLHQIRYTDSGVIVQMFTREYGRLSFLIKGARNRKAGKHTVLFQPLFILDLELYYKSARELQTLKEFSAAYTSAGILNDIRKSTVSLFLGEVLNTILREESPHYELFDYLEQSVMFFDRSPDNYANFHIALLSGLTSFLGFEPGRKDSHEKRFFDFSDGSFVKIPPLNGQCANEEVSDILALFFDASYDTISDISLNGKLRDEVLDALLRFYSFHLPGVKKIKSLSVLKEVFG